MLVFVDPVAAASAVDPANRPTAVAGETNGRLPASLLIAVQPRCVAHRAAAASLRLMLDAAHRAGVALGTNECYRSLDGQVRERARFGPCAAPVQQDAQGRPVGTSMHGWGKAVDLTDGVRGLTFASPAYRWLTAHAADYGWNHPGWARAGGSGCDEPWHWEWVGDGGTMGGDPVKADVVAVMSTPDGEGWWSVSGLGAVTPGGTAADYGGADTVPLQRVVVGGVATPTGNGYWLVAGDGGIFAFGDAEFFGSMGGVPLNQPIVGMAATPTGNGYWLVAADGGIFAFGDAAFFGSMGGRPLNRPMVGMAPTPSGRGYWTVASDGGMFAFGDAAFLGSMGGRPINRHVVGMAPATQGTGYWLVADDGGMFAFGDAPFRGSLAGRETAPVIGMSPTPTGYRFVAVDGTVSTFE
ncbi:MAG: M15 family metallopeptidase [Actinomycetota bacterium]|nr:M15 family metallopeptidase [Actinomycetota bacterium]